MFHCEILTCLNFNKFQANAFIRHKIQTLSFFTNFESAVKTLPNSDFKCKCETILDVHLKHKMNIRRIYEGTKHKNVSHLKHQNIQCWYSNNKLNELQKLFAFSYKMFSGRWLILPNCMRIISISEQQTNIYSIKYEFMLAQIAIDAITKKILEVNAN